MSLVPVASRLPLEPQPPEYEQVICLYVASRLPLEPQPPEYEQVFCLYYQVLTS
jgi:hypothetical protein